MTKKAKKKSNKNTLNNGRYIVQNVIGEGSFGIVYKAFDTKLNQDCAIKKEKGWEHETISNEDKIYNHLGKLDGLLQKIDFFVSGNSQHVVFNLVDEKDILKRMCNYTNKVHDLKTVIMIGKQLINIIQRFHDAGFIHRDIKPENMAMGTGKDAAKLYLLDMGIAKKYNAAYFDCKRGNVGNVRYASLNSHHGYDLSRRDDLETIAYVLIFMLKGRLPWQGLNNGYVDHWHIVYKVKKSLSTTELCSGLPSEFRSILKYARKLGFFAKPDYNYIIQLLDKVARDNNFELDDIYPWTTKDDPAMKLKQEKLEEEQDRVRRLQILARRKKLCRKFRYPASTSDKFFSDQCGLSLKQKQAIIKENMRKEIYFPNLAPPVFPPPALSTPKAVSSFEVVPEKDSLKENSQQGQDVMLMDTCIIESSKVIEDKLPANEALYNIVDMHVTLKENILEETMNVGKAQVAWANTTATGNIFNKGAEDSLEALVNDTNNVTNTVETKAEQGGTQALVVASDVDCAMDIDRKAENSEIQAAALANKMNKADDENIAEVDTEEVSVLVIDKNNVMDDSQKEAEKDAQAAAEFTDKSNAMNVENKVVNDEKEVVVVIDQNDVEIQKKAENNAAAADGTTNDPMDVDKNENGKNDANKAKKKKKMKKMKRKATNVAIETEEAGGQPKKRTYKEKQAGLLALVKKQAEEEKERIKAAKEYEKRLNNSKCDSWYQKARYQPSQALAYNQWQIGFHGQPVVVAPFQNIHPLPSFTYRIQQPKQLPAFRQKQMGFGHPPQATFHPVFGTTMQNRAHQYPLPEHLEGSFLF